MTDLQTKAALTEADVLALQQMRKDAVFAADGPVFDKLLSERFLQVHGGGTLQTKAEYIASRVSPTGIKFKSMEAYDTEVLLLGASALVRGNLDVHEIFPDGRELAGRVRFSNLWVKEEDGVWRLVHAHTTNRSSPRAQ